MKNKTESKPQALPLSARQLVRELLLFPFRWFRRTTWPKRAVALTFIGVLSLLWISERSTEYWWLRCKGELGLATHSQAKISIKKGADLMQELKLLNGGRKPNLNDVAHLYEDSIVSEAAIERAIRYSVRHGDETFFGPWDLVPTHTACVYPLAHYVFFDALGDPQTRFFSNEFLGRALELTGVHGIVAGLKGLEELESKRDAARSLAKNDFEVIRMFPAYMNYATERQLKYHYLDRIEKWHSPVHDIKIELNWNRFSDVSIVEAILRSVQREPNSLVAQAYWGTQLHKVLGSGARPLHDLPGEGEQQIRESFLQFAQSIGTQTGLSSSQLADLLTELCNRRSLIPAQPDLARARALDFLDCEEQFPVTWQILEAGEYRYCVAIAIQESLRYHEPLLLRALPLSFMGAHDQVVQRFGACLALDFYVDDWLDATSDPATTLQARFLAKRIEFIRELEALSDWDPLFTRYSGESTRPSPYFLWCLIEGELTLEQEELAMDYALLLAEMIYEAEAKWAHDSRS